MTNINETELDWDSEILEDGSSFTLLDPGEYDFTVEKFERKLSKNGNKMAALTLKVTDGNVSTTVFDNLTLVKSAEWKLSSFFGALGLKKKNEPLKMDWQAIYGKTGRCKIKIEEYDKKDGNIGETNRIDAYIYKEDVTNNNNDNTEKVVQGSFPEEKTGFSGSFNFGEFKGN